MGFINIGVSTHYSNVNSLSSRPNMSPSKPEQYLESLESKGIMFAEQNGLYNWTEKKLLLDAVVIQQGRLNSASSSSSSSKLSTREMATMVTYGTDFIFSSTKGTYTVGRLSIIDSISLISLK